MARKIAVVGTGYVGLIASIGLSSFGNYVTAVDKKKRTVENLKNRKAAFYEPGLTDYLHRCIESGRLTFTTEIAEAVREAEVVFLAVGTPLNESGETDLRQIEEVVLSVREHLDAYKVIVTKSTVPVGTNRWIEKKLEESKSHDLFSIVSNPEFLREGRAIQDFFHPDRVVIGYEDENAREILEEIYRPLYLIQTPFVWCNVITAELIKYACNSFLANKITFINEMANLAEVVGADVHTIARAMGMDGRISPKYLHPGPGYGGSCLPKDTQELVNTGRRHGVNLSLAKAVIRSNNEQKSRIAEKLLRLLGSKDKSIAVLGLAFKSETDDVRCSAAIDTVAKLLAAGAEIHAHDPKAMGNFKKLFPEVLYFNSEFDAVEGTDAVLILTEWNEYRNIDLYKVREKMRGNLILDARNVLEPGLARSLGFDYYGIGR